MALFPGPRRDDQPLRHVLEVGLEGAPAQRERGHIVTPLSAGLDHLHPTRVHVHPAGAAEDGALLELPRRSQRWQTCKPRNRSPLLQPVATCSSHGAAANELRREKGTQET